MPPTVLSQVPPFSGVLDWDLFSITIPTAKIPSLRRILRAANHTKLHANLRRVRRAFALRRAVFDGAAKPRPPRRQGGRPRCAPLHAQVRSLFVYTERGGPMLDMLAFEMSQASAVRHKRTG